LPACCSWENRLLWKRAGKTGQAADSKGKGKRQQPFFEKRREIRRKSAKNGILCK
jgi:hypothetical protein